jgi:hypothetical protein
MNISDLLSVPRYGIYLPQSKITQDFEYTSYGSTGFNISTSLQLGSDETFEKVGQSIKDFIDKGTIYLEEKDLDLLGVLLRGMGQGMDYVIKFDKQGITLASLITVDAKKVQFIYEKYSATSYQLQLSLTHQSSIKFAWAKNGLKGDFYFNIKRSIKEDVTTITGYTSFHLGNETGAKPVTMSAGIVNRLPIKAKSADKPNTETDPAPKPKKVRHTYVRLQSRSYKGITIADIVGMVTPNNVEIPDMLDKVAIYDFAVLHSSDADAKELAIVLDCTITLSEKELATKLTIISKKEGDSTHSFSFHGRVSIDEHQFDIDFSKTTEGADSSWAILASYINKGTVTIEFKKLAASLFGDGIDFPDLKLTVAKPKVFFYYQKAKSAKEGEEKSKGKLLIGMGAGIDIPLQNLPLAGGVLVEMKAFQFKEVLVLYANDAFEKKDLTPLSKNKLLPKNFEIGKGVSISAELLIDGTSEYLSLGGAKIKNPEKPVSDTAPNKDKNDKPSTEVVKKMASSVASEAKWLILDKKIGPVNLQRLGLAYHEGKVIALLDASIETKGMAMQMMGLGVGFKLDWSDLDLDFYLYGLGLSYKTDAVEISGAFLRGNSGGIETYNGAARLKMKAFTISAIGSYAKTENGDSSLFIYGLFEGNIGGPPEFYVTGIAAGFGYNRKINAPELTDIAAYPLVALAMQPDDKSLLDVLKSLEEPMSNGKLPIEISQGNYWLALGVKFTTYKILESFVLITVNFGTKTEFNVLGLSRMNWPEKSLRDKVNLKEPIVFVELVIRVSFGMDSDVIKVEGMITPNSYVLSKDCKLTGGFALYTWISGEHAGDFVLTIGGYHPRFKKPDHYPIVPRVGLNWKMGEYLMLKGELYFALTSSGIMMGGRWELIFNTPIVKAAFTLWIDLLIQWAPFYYDLSIGIMIDIEAHIPLKVCTIHLSLHFRAALQIWGPPFSGIAEIDLGIYSFEIRFGSEQQPERNPLQWQEFAEGFLPKAKEDQAPRSRGLEMDTASLVPLDCINANVSNGVIQIIEEQGKEKFYIANPMQMAIAIDSTIPVKQLLFNEQEIKTTSASVFGVQPCGLSGDKVEFDMRVSLTLNNKENKVKDNIKTAIITRGFPKALWGVASDAEDKNSPSTELLKGITSGISITTVAPTPHYLQAYDFSTFLESMSKADSVAIPALESAEVFKTNDVYSEMQKYEQVSAQRNSMIEALKDLNMGFDTGDDFEKLASVGTVYTDASVFFRAEPKLCKMGHAYHNPTDT